MADTEKITEEQAGEALQQLLQSAKSERGDESQPGEPAAEETATAAPAESEPKPAVEPTQAEAPEQAVAAEDDLASLQSRLSTLEQERERDKSQYESRWKALRDRNAQNERILRDRYLRKSSQLDRALKTLRATRTESGVAESEVDGVIREIESTLNPASANYTPPQPEPTMTNEDQAMIANAFLNEMGMSLEEAEEFRGWLTRDAQTALSEREQAVAQRDLDGFLRLAHTRWQFSMRDNEKKNRRDEAVDAVKVVQRTQREAARAATASPPAPKKAPAKPRDEIDVTKLTQEDISRLLRDSVLQSQ